MSSPRAPSQQAELSGLAAQASESASEPAVELGEPEDLGLPPDIGQRPAGAMVRAIAVAWPAFVMAGVLEMLVFAVVDPADLHWLGGEPITASRQAIYTGTFLLFWAVMLVSGGLSLLLAREPGRARA